MFLRRGLLLVLLCFLLAIPLALGVNKQECNEPPGDEAWWKDGGIWCYDPVKKDYFCAYPYIFEQGWNEYYGRDCVVNQNQLVYFPFDDDVSIPKVYKLKSLKISGYGLAFRSKARPADHTAGQSYPGRVGGTPVDSIPSDLISEGGLGGGGGLGAYDGGDQCAEYNCQAGGAGAGGATLTAGGQGGWGSNFWNEPPQGGLAGGHVLLHLGGPRGLNITDYGLLSVNGGNGLHSGWSYCGSDSHGAGGCSGPGGGGGAGVLWIYASNYDINGSIRATGGTGGNGFGYKLVDYRWASSGGGGAGARGFVGFAPVDGYSEEELCSFVVTENGDFGERDTQVMHGSYQSSDGSPAELVPSDGDDPACGLISGLKETDPFFFTSLNDPSFCNNFFDDDGDGLSDMQDPDCWNSPPEGVCVDNAGFVSDFASLTFDYASSLTGFDGCCGDDTNIGGSSDLFFLDSDASFFCSKDWSGSGSGFDSVVPVSEDSNWKWWGAKNHKFIIHKITGDNG